MLACGFCSQVKLFLFASGFLRAVQVLHQHVFSGGGTDSVHSSTQDRLPVHLLGTTGKKTAFTQ